MTTSRSPRPSRCASDRAYSARRVSGRSAGSRRQSAMRSQTAAGTTPRSAFSTSSSSRACTSITSRPRSRTSSASVVCSTVQRAHSASSTDSDARRVPLGQLVLGVVTELRDRAESRQAGVALDRVIEALPRRQIGAALAQRLEHPRRLLEERQEAGAIGGEALEHRHQLGLLGLLARAQQLRGDVVDDDQHAALPLRPARRGHLVAARRRVVG